MLKAKASLFGFAVAILSAGVLLLVSCNQKKQVSLIVHHGKIYTVNDSFNIVQAMAIDNGKIVATGTNEDILAGYKSKESINADGLPVYPGFIDAHCHFTGYATDMWKCELYGTKSFDEIIQKVAQYAQKTPSEWVYGRGWDQNVWPVKEFPNKQILDSLFPDRPVFLKRIDGHAVLANQKALDIGGFTIQTKIPGGEVEVRNGKLTGMLIDRAMELLETNIPVISDSLAKSYFLKAQQECLELGLTSVHDCGISEHTLEMVDEEQKAGRLKMKIFALLSDTASYFDKWIARGPYKTERLHMGGFKVYADGALGSRGACLKEPYSDKKDWHGFMLTDAARLHEIAGKMIGSGLQLCTHAIGDSGTREVLNAYARVLKGKNDRRWRIEHAQVVDPKDFHLFSQYNIIPSVQPTHASSDMYWAEKRLGPDRVTHAYAYQTLLQTNGWMPLGTDFPVEYISPFKTFYAATERRDGDGFPPEGFQKKDALSREQTLRGITIWAAKAAFEEQEKGSLEPGKSADFIILNRDIMQCPPSDILTTKVIGTFINGEKLSGR